MMKVLITLVIVLLLVGGVGAYYFYSIPQLIPTDYNCEQHPGIISDSNPFLFESSQHYVNRKNTAIQKQIEEACG